MSAGAECEVLQLEGKEHQGLATTRRWKQARKDSPQQVSEGTWPCPHLNYVLLTSRTMRHKFLFFCFKPFSLWYVLSGALGTDIVASSDQPTLKRTFKPLHRHRASSQLVIIILQHEWWTKDYAIFEKIKHERQAETNGIQWRDYAERTHLKYHHS